MWCNDHHPKLRPYFVEKPFRHISLHWNLKKWIQKFSLKQETSNQIKKFVKEIKSNLESCPPSTITISNKQTFLKQPTKQLSASQHIEFNFEPPKQIDLIGSFLFYGACYNAKYAHTDHFNVDISVAMPAPISINLADLTDDGNKHYLLKRRVYLDVLYKHLKQQKIATISDAKQPCEIFVDYLNHDASKPIIILQPAAHCYVRIIPCLDIKQFITDTKDENMVMDEIFFGRFYSKYVLLKQQYGSDLESWSGNKLGEALHSDLNAAKPFNKQQLFAHYLYAQQIMEDIIMKSTFMEFYGACKINPNLHRALVLIKAWWNNTNFHVDAANMRQKAHTDSTRFGDINSFHLTMFLLLFFRTYHFEKWDSPLVVMAKFLELISREELGTLLCKKPPCSLFERNPNWCSPSFADSHLFTSLTANISNSRDRASIFNPKRIDFAEKDSKANANIYSVGGEDGDSVADIHYSYNIWKTKKKGISQAYPSNSDDVLFDDWIDDKRNKIYLRLLSNRLFPVLFTNISGRINYTFRVNRGNYLYFIRQARKASHSLNALLLEIPFMPNPEYWSYKSMINAAEFDIVTAQIMTFHQKCLQSLLTPNNLQFFMYFDGFIKLKNVFKDNCNGNGELYALNELEDVLIEGLSDRCRSFVLKYNNNNEIFIGLSMHTFPYRELIYGPPNKEKFAVKKFKQFWGGNVVEMKRFTDGTLLNIININNQFFRLKYQHLFKSEKQSEKKRAPSSVIKVILHHLFKQHLDLNIGRGDISLILDPFWSITPSFLANSKKIGDKTDILSLNKAYYRLEKLLRYICYNKERTGIPLKLRELVPISPYLCNTWMTLPKQKNMRDSSYSLIDNMQIIEIGMKFEKKANDLWPKSSISAINNLKIAFYIQFHRAFKTCKVKSLLAKKYIDVIIHGFNFRIFIICDHEFALYKHPNFMRPHKYKFKFLPKIGRILQGVSRNYSYFSPTICLVKKWLNCNLFSDLIDINLINVLVADLFVNCDPYQCPRSAYCGLLRFLYLLTNYDWIENPYVIDLGIYDQNKKEQQSGAIAYEYNIFKTQMLNCRMNDNGLHAMYVIVLGLEQHSFWTKSKPNLQTLNRLISVARMSLNHLLKCMDSNEQYLRIYKANKNEFDFIIHLNVELIPNYMDNIWKTEKGKNKWKQQQILKRMSKITMQIEKDRKAKEKQKKLNEAVNSDKKKNIENEVLPFIKNAAWEAKKRKFEADAIMDEPASKRRKRNSNVIQLQPSKSQALIEENPSKFLQENELTVIGVNPIELFLSEINKFMSLQIQVFYNENGGDFIACKWLIDANYETQKTIYCALWELGKDLIKSIEIKKIKKKKQFSTILNMMHINDKDNNDKEVEGGWTVVDAKHNI